jgi:hypothetical protein
MKSLLDTDGKTTDQTRVPAQKVRNSWSDRGIVLHFLQEFPDVVFLGVAMKSLRDANDVWSAQTID